jgi:glycosyltransferase involved in cell wall biosynthesis
MKVSVIVPAYNEERLLAGSLAATRDAMRAFGEAGWESELIVCDNNSTDRTAEIARAAGAMVVFEPQNQIARARNAGAAQASGDWLLFVDADSYPSIELLRDTVAAIGSGRCLAGGATQATDSRDATFRWSMALWNRLSRAARWGAGAFIFCEARAFRELGGFSEELYASEEIDLFRRLKRRARRDGRAIVILHRHPLRTSDRKWRLYTAGEFFRFLLKLLFFGHRTVRDRSACHAWYDGRR